MAAATDAKCPTREQPRLRQRDEPDVGLDDAASVPSEPTTKLREVERAAAGDAVEPVAAGLAPVAREAARDRVAVSREDPASRGRSRLERVRCRAACALGLVDGPSARARAVREHDVELVRRGRSSCRRRASGCRTSCCRSCRRSWPGLTSRCPARSRGRGRCRAVQVVLHDAGLTRARRASASSVADRGPCAATSRARRRPRRRLARQARARAARTTGTSKRARPRARRRRRRRRAGRRRASGSTAYMLASVANRWREYASRGPPRASRAAARLASSPSPDARSSRPSPTGADRRRRRPSAVPSDAWPMRSGTAFPADPGADERARPRAARDRAPTIDHRGPDVRALGLRGARRAAARLQDARAGRRLPVVGHRRVGGGARQHALARRPRAHVRDRPLRDAVARDGRAARPRGRASCPATGGTASTPTRVEETLRADRGVDHGRARRAQRDVDRRDQPHRRVRAAIDAAGHPALLMVDTISSLGSIDYRHDEWGVDVTVARLAEGADAAARARLQRGQRRRRSRRRERAAAALLLGLGSRCSRTTATASSPTRPRRTCCSGCARRSRCSRRRGSNVFARHDRHAGDARAVARLGSRGPVRRSRDEYSDVADRGRDAGRARCRRGARA